MLFQQIPVKEIESLRYGIKINLLFIEFSIGAERDIDSSVQAKIATLDRYMARKKLLTGLSEKGLWLSYTGPCKMLQLEEEPNFTLIAGGTERVGFIAYCSTKNFIGAAIHDVSAAKMNFSFEPRVIGRLRSVMTLEGQLFSRHRKNYKGVFSQSVAFNPDMSDLNIGSKWNFDELHWSHIFDSLHYDVCNKAGKFHFSGLFKRSRGPFPRGGGRTLSVATPVWLKAVPA